MEITWAADGRLKLGRPWHNSPKAVYINTIMLIPVAEEGWTNMERLRGFLQNTTAMTRGESD